MGRFSKTCKKYKHFYTKKTSRNGMKYSEQISLIEHIKY